MTAKSTPTTRLSRRRTMLVWLAACWLGLSVLFAPASAQQKISGTVFFDYTFYLTNNGPSPPRPRKPEL